MIKHIWSILCKESNVDEKSNSISIDEAYENLQVSIKTGNAPFKKGQPVNLPINFEIVSLFFREEKGREEQTDEFVVILDPKGLKLAELSAQIIFKDKYDRMRNVFKFDALPLTSSGTYLFQVFTQAPKSNKREPVTIIPLDIKVSLNDKLI